MYRIYYVKNNYTFWDFTSAIFRLRSEKPVSSYTRLMWVLIQWGGKGWSGYENSHVLCRMGCVGRAFYLHFRPAHQTHTIRGLLNCTHSHCHISPTAHILSHTATATFHQQHTFYHTQPLPHFINSTHSITHSHYHISPTAHILSHTHSHCHISSTAHILSHTATATFHQQHTFYHTTIHSFT